jgi:hypothetical protein
MEEPGFIPAVKVLGNLWALAPATLSTTYADPFLMGN